MRGIERRLKPLSVLGAAALVGAGLGLAACGGEGGESGEKAGGHASVGGEAGESAAAPVAAAPAAASSGGETGEAGAADAYAGLTGPTRTAVRFQHLKSFLLAAQAAAKAGQPAEASVLISQGLLEVYDAAPAELPGASRTKLDAVAALGMAEPADPKFADAIARAGFELDDLQKKAGGIDPELVRRMLALTRGLYGEVFPEGGGVDATEYSHAYGAALGAQDALAKASIGLASTEKARVDAAKAEMAKLVALFAGPTAPETPASKRDVLAQIARVELALSGL